MSLKEARHALGGVLGDALDVAVAAFGANVNPPCVLVRPAPEYVAAAGYCAELVRFEAVVLPGAGEGEASADELDDLIDEVREALRKPVDGFKFTFQSVSLLADEFGAACDITYERVD